MLFYVFFHLCTLNIINKPISFCTNPTPCRVPPGGGSIEMLSAWGNDKPLATRPQPQRADKYKLKAFHYTHPIRHLHTLETFSGMAASIVCKY